MTKACFKCGKVKPLDDFYRHPRMSDGHLNKCKECTKKDVRAHRRANDSVREYDRARAKLPHRRANSRRMANRWRLENPLGHKAQTTLRKAVKSGEITKEPCFFCETTENVHARHHDYSKPLEVTWLCAKCHHRFHAMSEKHEGAHKS